jgi:hypothetical protein
VDDVIVLVMLGSRIAEPQRPARRFVLGPALVPVMEHEIDVTSVSIQGESVTVPVDEESDSERARAGPGRGQRQRQQRQDQRRSAAMRAMMGRRSA